MGESEFGEQRDRRREGPDAEDQDNATFADVMNGFSFDSGRKRGRRKRAEKKEAEQSKQPPEPPPPPPPPGRAPGGGGAPPGGWGTGPQPPVAPHPPDWGAPAPPVRGVPAAGPDHAPPSRAGAEREWPAAADTEPEVAASSIRSYTWTGGRTRSNYELQMETLVSTSETYRSGTSGRMEHESIAELCRHPRSVAEVGALLSVPIGVARVLLADMAELGMITVHQTVTESGSAPHLMLMERVLSGLRRL